MLMPKILLVDDDLGSIRMLSRMLDGTGTLQFATTGEDALRLIREAPPALILLDAEMPGMSGFQVCERLKGDAALADIPVIFVTSHSETAFEVSGFDIGAVDFIAKPVSQPLLVARVKTQLRIKQLSDELRRLSTIDGLTQVGNRRAFDQRLLDEWQRARRTGEPLSLLIVDVDHFKRYNDQHGHPAGDACLQAVAASLVQACSRPADFVARYGGEEFALLLPGTPCAGAVRVATRILDAVEARNIPHADSPTSHHVTVCIGLTSVEGPVGGAPAEPPVTGEFHLTGRLLQAADKALYAAKEAGRAQAWQLDFADWASPERAREIVPRFEASAPARL